MNVEFKSVEWKRVWPSLRCLLPEYVPEGRRSGGKRTVYHMPIPVLLWGLSLFKIAPFGSIFYGTKWLFRRPHVQDPALHSKYRIFEGIMRRGGTVDHCGSGARAKKAHPLDIHSFIHTICPWSDHVETLPTEVSVPADSTRQQFVWRGL
jgi:hypothetical protein